MSVKVKTGAVYFVMVVLLVVIISFFNDHKTIQACGPTGKGPCWGFSACGGIKAGDDTCEGAQNCEALSCPYKCLAGSADEYCLGVFGDCTENPMVHCSPLEAFTCTYRVGGCSCIFSHGIGYCWRTDC